MKSTTYTTEITTQKNENCLSAGRNPLAFSPACLLALCQLRNFPREFTEKYFAVFHQSPRMIYLTWYRLLLIFPGIFFCHFFYGMTSNFYSYQGEGLHFYV